MPEPAFDCCDHCDHAKLDVPHDTPCDRGCNAYELEEAEDAACDR